MCNALFKAVRRKSVTTAEKFSVENLKKRIDFERHIECEKIPSATKVGIHESVTKRIQVC